jgi:hypothetical protein
MANLGKVMTVFRGAYNVSTQYERLDVVTYNSSSWVAKQTTTGHTPPTDGSESNTYWQLMAKGYTGSSFNDLTDKPTTISGYGITNAYTKTEVDNITGDLSELETESNADLVGSVNEVNANVGDKSSLLTTIKTNIVNAINELVSSISNKVSKGDLVINVKDYGAKGDGVTDDTTAINLAISSNKGKRIHSPSGTYIISSPIVVYAKTKLSGDGFTTIFKQANGANIDAIIKSEQFDTLVNTNTSGHGISDISLEHLAINGNLYSDYALPSMGVQNNTIGTGIKIYGSSLYMSDISVYNCPENGIYTEGSSYESPLLEPHGTESNFMCIRSNFNGKNGWVYRGPHDSKFYGLLIGSNSRLADITYDNFVADSSKGTGVITNSHFYMTWVEQSPLHRIRYSVCIKNSGGWRFVNCDIEGGGSANGYLESSDLDMFTNCTIYATTGGSDFALNGATNCQFLNCLFTNYSTLDGETGTHSWAGAINYYPNSGNKSNNFINCEIRDTFFSSTTANDGGFCMYILHGKNSGGRGVFNNITGAESTDIVIVQGEFADGQYIYFPNNITHSLNGEAAPLQYNIVPNNITGDTTVYNSQNIQIDGYTSGTVKLKGQRGGSKIFVYNRMGVAVPIGLSDGLINGSATFSVPANNTSILFFYEENNAIVTN